MNLDEIKTQLKEMNAAAKRVGLNGGGEAARNELVEKIQEGIESPLGRGRLATLALKPALDVAREVVAWCKAVDVPPPDAAALLAEQVPKSTPATSTFCRNRVGEDIARKKIVPRQLDGALARVLTDLYSHRDASLAQLIGDALLKAGITSVDEARHVNEAQLAEAGVKKGPRMSLMKWAKANRPAAWEV